MQRSTSSSGTSSDENNSIVHLLRTSRAKLIGSTKSSCCHDHHRLPLHHTRHGSFSSGPRSSHRNWVIHLIPLVVLLCLFALWWSSYPVDVEVKDGRVTAVRQVEIPRSLNETRIDLTSLAVDMPQFITFRQGKRRLQQSRREKFSEEFVAPYIDKCSSFLGRQPYNKSTVMLEI